MRARRGISLFEAVAAVTIVGITSVSALSAVGAEMRTAERARRAIEVEALATSRLDFMTLLADRELQNLADTIAKGKFDAPLDAYRWEATSSPVSDQAGVYDVRVNVIWTVGSYTLRTYFYRRPPLASAAAARGR
jgi:type II secretory pathway pseudopilin PulG